MIPSVARARPDSGDPAFCLLSRGSSSEQQRERRLRPHPNVRVLGAVLSVNFIMRRRVLPASHRGHPGGELTQIPRCLNAPPHSSMSIMGGRRAAAALFLALLGEAAAFYLPGVAPRKYKTGERMRVKVNTLTSDLTPLQVAYCPFMPPQPSSPCSLCVLMFGIDACLRSGQTD